MNLVKIGTQIFNLDNILRVLNYENGNIEIFYPSGESVILRDDECEKFWEYLVSNATDINSPKGKPKGSGVHL